MYKEDLALNNRHWLICHKTPNKPSDIHCANSLFSTSAFGIVFNDVKIRVGLLVLFTKKQTILET